MTQANVTPNVVLSLDELKAKGGKAEVLADNVKAIFNSQIDSKKMPKIVSDVLDFTNGKAGLKMEEAGFTFKSVDNRHGDPKSISVTTLRSYAEKVVIVLSALGECKSALFGEQAQVSGEADFLDTF